jgi:SOS-response transcriptional repressor LexA
VQNIQVSIAGEIAPGEPVYPSSEKLELPKALVGEQTDLVYRVRSPFPEVSAGDYLIVEARDHAATGELVLAFRARLVYLGRFWAKQGLRELRSPSGETIATDLSIIGAVTLVVRPGAAS